MMCSASTALKGLSCEFTPPRLLSRRIPSRRCRPRGRLSSRSCISRPARIRPSRVIRPAHSGQRASAPRAASFDAGRRLMLRGAAGRPGSRPRPTSGCATTILAEIKAALPVDGVVLALHGAMVAYGYDDCEGDLLERVRSLVGADCVIGVELDPHCHLTRRKRCALRRHHRPVQGISAHRFRRARRGGGDAGAGHDRGAR